MKTSTDGLAVLEGSGVGCLVGADVGDLVKYDGRGDGRSEGSKVGLGVGLCVGLTEGNGLGMGVGCCVGRLGNGDGADVGWRVDTLNFTEFASTSDCPAVEELTLTTKK